MNEQTLLAAIGSTEETTFHELCLALGENKPSEKAEWRELFLALERLERNGFVSLDRVQGKIDTLILTEDGAERVRAELDAKRGLFNL